MVVRAAICLALKDGNCAVVKADSCVVVSAAIPDVGIDEICEVVRPGMASVAMPVIVAEVNCAIELFPSREISAESSDVTSSVDVYVVDVVLDVVAAELTLEMVIAMM